MGNRLQLKACAVAEFLAEQKGPSLVVTLSIDSMVWKINTSQAITHRSSPPPSQVTISIDLARTQVHTQPDPLTSNLIDK